jgi:hypothetical protein
VERQRDQRCNNKGLQLLSPEEQKKTAKKRNQQNHILTHMSTAGHRLGKKNVPEVTLSTIEGHPLLGNEQINTRL